MKKIVLKSIIVLILSLFLYKCIFLVDGRDYEYLLGDLNQDELIESLRQDNFTDHLEQLADQKMKEYLIKKLA